MKNFNRNNRFDGKGKGGRFADRNSGRPAMHKAVCSECGQDCEVPFRPTGDKPVFCSNCFQNKGGKESRGSRGRDSGGFKSSDRRMHDAVCDKCGKKCEVPFRPTGDKPIYCSLCFDKGGKDKGPDQTSGQFEIINAKLDKILNLLSSVDLVEVEAKKEKSKKKVITQPKKESKSKAKKAVSSKKVKAKKK